MKVLIHQDVTHTNMQMIRHWMVGEDTKCDANICLKFTQCGLCLLLLRKVKGQVEIEAT